MRVAVVTLAALALAACGSDRDEPVADAARTFAQALRSGDVDRACSALAPSTVQELERSAGRACAQALGEQELGTLERVGAVERYGRQASVEVQSTSGETDTWFLSRQDGRWLLVAASCRPRRDLPYDCDLEGP